MNVLVVGGAGYVGGAVMDLLLQSEHNTRVYDALLYEEAYRKPVDFVYGDVRDREKLRPHLSSGPMPWSGWRRWWVMELARSTRRSAWRSTQPVPRSKSSQNCSPKIPEYPSRASLLAVMRKCCAAVWPGAHLHRPQHLGYYQHLPARGESHGRIPDSILHIMCG